MGWSCLRSASARSLKCGAGLKAGATYWRTVYGIAAAMLENIFRMKTAGRINGKYARLKARVDRNASANHDGPGSTCPFACQHRKRRLYQELEVQQKRPLGDILDVHADHVVKIGPASAFHLPQAGDSRFDN